MMDDSRNAGSQIGDRHVLLGWALCLFLLYGFFYQGGGWDQNARFDTVRALVEQGSFEITPFAANTGDVVEHQGRLFANKPPGHARYGVNILRSISSCQKSTYRRCIKRSL